MFYFSLSTSVTSLENNNPNITITYDTSIKGELTTFGDIYVKDNELELLNITVTNIYAGAISTINLTIPFGINITEINPPSGWLKTNTTDAGGLIEMIMFENTSSDSSIKNGTEQSFSIKFKLNETRPSEGPINFTLNLTDTDNQNNIYENLTIIVDTLAPSGMVCDNPIMSGYGNNTSILTVNGNITISCGSEVNLTVNATLMHYSDSVQDTNWSQSMIEYSISTGNYSTQFDINQNNPHDGLNQTIIIIFEDLAGNKNTTILAYENLSIDTWDPEIELLYINSTPFEENYPGEFEWNKTVNISVMAKDNTTNVTGISANISFIASVESENNQTYVGIYTLEKTEDNIWELNFSDTNRTGRYLATITVTDNVSLTTIEEVWFDLYEKIIFEGNIRYNVSSNLNSTITFNRIGVSEQVHKNSTDNTGTYAFEIGKREYNLIFDVKMPDTDYTNGETNVISFDSWKTDSLNNTNNIVKFFDFDVNSSAIHNTNKSIALLGLWLNDSLEDSHDSNTVQITLNLSKNTESFNVNGILLYVCNNWTNDTCDGASELDIENTVIDPIKKTITYNTNLSELFGMTISLPSDKNNTLWFVAFEPAVILFENNEILDASNIDSNMTLKFYRQGTDLLLYDLYAEVSTPINVPIYNGSYDLNIDIYHTFDESKNIIDVYGVDMRDISDGSTNITDILTFKYLNYCGDDSCGPQSPQTILDSFNLPDQTTGVGYAGMSVNTDSRFKFTGANITLDYTKANSINPLVLDNLRVYRCADYDTDSCSKSDWVEVDFVKPTDGNIKIVTVPVTSFSTYVLTQFQAYNPPSDTDSSSGGSGSSSNIFSSTSCGDDVCSVGEDFLNCPNDCGLSVTCGNSICDFFETRNNCPIDCTIQGMSEISFDTTMSSVYMSLNSEKLYDLWVTNNINKTLNANIHVAGEIGAFIPLELKDIEIGGYSSRLISFNVSVPFYASVGYYNGEIVAEIDGKLYTIPISMTITSTDAVNLEVSIKKQSKNIILGSPLLFNMDLHNLGASKNILVFVENDVKDVLTDKVIYNQKTDIILENRTTTSQFEIFIDKSNYSIGDYYLLTTVYTEAMEHLYVTTPFKVINPFWTPKRILFAGYWIILLTFTGGLAYIYRWYMKNKRANSRYLPPLDFSKLPLKSDRSLWLGNIAETKKKALFSPEDITTHILVAGSTGSGKSVSTSVFVEEALLKKIPVVIFDPTAQWTGFVKACTDENLLKHYSKFNMKREDAKPFKGLIYGVDSPDIKIDFKRFMNPGEVTVFNLNKLGPGEYDQAVMKIIQTIFDSPWEESPELKLLLVFDEVHRLLEKYGGKGGYIALEKACREFRKWGIGIIMASQVSADFKEAVQGNILTEVQLNTKSAEDIAKIKSKYGADFAGRISKQAIGVGLIQNPKYNNGKPWFVNFRPTLHNPHKISEDELKQYNDFTSKLETIETELIAREKKNIDTTDLRLEFKLAQDKLKTGRFRMAEIYLNTLTENLKKK